jgi:hypothetical protein
MIRCPLINTPLQRGDLWSAISELFQKFRHVHEAAKTVETVATERGVPDTQLKLGVNEKLLSSSRRQEGRGGIVSG